ncbi:hypothetical protein F5Y19DRAFT_431596 [Xylariaceae sp. FL1651]|nr:hypothetical protein F5Y19DRAFT_431596 [Xylariaceae sp. FL1651]
MANNLESALNNPLSTPGSSPSDVLGDTKFGRSLVRIASDQKTLLERPESWASFLSRRPNGFVNVPPSVLEQLKRSHARRTQAIQPDKAPDSTLPSIHDADVPNPSGSQSSPLFPIEREAEDRNDDDEHHEDETSWASSPVHHLHPPRAESEEPNHQQVFITQLPEKSPPQPTVQASSDYHRIPKFPQSSQGPEDELELEVPAALAYNPISINKSALPVLATPPSAQVVPCTFEQSGQSASTNTSARSDSKPNPRSRQPIYKPVPKFYRPPKQGITPTHLSTIASAADVVAVDHQPIDTESSLSAANTSSSIIQSTNNDHGNESNEHTPIWAIQPVQTSTNSTNPNFENHQSLLVSPQHSPLYVPPSPARAVLSPQPPVAVIQPTVQPTVALKSWEAPFIHFTVTYPSYSGTVQDFVTACMYIQLQHRRIRTSLYDDFIRAWVEGYLSYVRDCDEAQPPRKALRAIEWYNEIDDDPLFTSRVVTRQNLPSILTFYPDELQIARSALGISSNSAPSERSLSSHGAKSFVKEKDISLPISAHVRQWKGKESIQDSIETETVASSLPLPKPAVPPFPTRHTMSAHRSFGGVESRPAQGKSLTRSLSETTSHKREAPNDLHSEGTKRRSVGLKSGGPNHMMWSDSGSTTSNHSEQSRAAAWNSVALESTAGKRNNRDAEDPEERRRRRLAKHFRRRLAEMESIASSAPISNTPTSGQRH